ncbi:hypothetical protein HWV62_4041 [Athelia sp. TMB]|nr:hypothetical protein HWV62_4041 [Athelia sp. TMB]
MLIAIPASDDAWNEGLMEGATVSQQNIFSEEQFHTLARMMANAFRMTRELTMNYVQQVAENIVNELDNCVGQSDFNTVETTTGENTTTLGIIEPQVANLSSQVANLNTQMSSKGTRQPKIGEPPEFNGADGKVKFQEWMNKIQLWVVHEDIVTDRHGITVAMNKLSGSAAQYMEPWIEKLTTGQTIGLWKEFVHELTIQYGQRDEKEGAKKELTALFINTDLAHKNFVKYAEKFRTLGRKAKEQINNNGKKKEKFCHICNHPSHNTIDCYNNAKGHNYKPCLDEKKEDKKKSPEDKKKSGKTHKIRSAETKQSSDSSDSEDDTPRASTSKEINSAEIDHPKIRELSYSEELTSDDEPFVPQSISDWRKGKKKVSRKQGFSRRHM